MRLSSLCFSHLGYHCSMAWELLLPGLECCQVILVSHQRLNLCLDLEEAPTGHQRWSQWQLPASPLTRAQLCLSHRTCSRAGIFAGFLIQSNVIGNKCNTMYQKLNSPQWHPAPKHKTNLWLPFVCWISSSQIRCSTPCFHFLLSGGRVVHMLFINAS